MSNNRPRLTIPDTSNMDNVINFLRERSHSERIDLLKFKGSLGAGFVIAPAIHDPNHIPILLELMPTDDIKKNFLHSVILNGPFLEYVNAQNFSLAEVKELFPYHAFEDVIDDLVKKTNSSWDLLKYSSRLPRVMIDSYLTAAATKLVNSTTTVGEIEKIKEFLDSYPESKASANFNAGISPKLKIDESYVNPVKASLIEREMEFQKKLFTDFTNAKNLLVKHDDDYLSAGQKQFNQKVEAWLQKFTTLQTEFANPKKTDVTYDYIAKVIPKYNSLYNDLQAIINDKNATYKYSKDPIFLSMQRHKAQLDTAAICLLILASGLPKELKQTSQNQATSQATPEELFTAQMQRINSPEVQEQLRNFKITPTLSTADRLHQLNDFIHQPEVKATLLKVGDNKLSSVFKPITSLFVSQKKDAAYNTLEKTLSNFARENPPSLQR